MTEWDPDEAPPPYTDHDVPWDLIEGQAVPQPEAPAPADDHHPTPFIDWSTFWARDRSEADFLLDDVIARGRGHALYAKHKTGKSLFMLWAAVEIIRRTDAVVVYLDYEMTEDDLQDRLEDMGCGPDTDLARLCYWLLPTLPPLNSAHGSDHLINLVQAVGEQWPGHHIAVVIDTTSRAIQGDENDAGPYQEFYRLTGLRLKQMGVTWVRLDHEGKDPTLGQRGSSAKGDDVDVGWKIAKADDGVTLTRKLSRISWVPEHVGFTIGESPLRYVRTGEQWPEGTKECAADLDELGAPMDLGGNQAVRLLRDEGRGRSRMVVLAACRWRRQQVTEGVR